MREPNLDLSMARMRKERAQSRQRWASLLSSTRQRCEAALRATVPKAISTPVRTPSGALEHAPKLPRYRSEAASSAQMQIGLSDRIAERAMPTRPPEAGTGGLCAGVGRRQAGGGAPRLGLHCWLHSSTSVLPPRRACPYSGALVFACCAPPLRSGCVGREGFFTVIGRSRCSR